MTRDATAVEATSASTARSERIALFIPSLGGGGAERVMLNLSAGFVRRGFAVDLVVVTARGALSGGIPHGVRLIDLNSPRAIASLPNLIRYLRRERPAAMLSALGATNCIAIWARCLARVATRLVVSEHSTLSHAAAHATTRRGRRMPEFMRWSYPHADVVVAVSQGVADDLAIRLGIKRRRIRVIYNPVVTPELLAKVREPVDHPWLAPQQPPVILGVGRLVPEKGFATLIRSFAMLRQTSPARLMILGEGPQRSALEKLADELGVSTELAMPGFVANPYTYMRAARVFVLSSHWEGLPTVVIEAMACGSPVITTNCPGGTSEILENGRWGVVVTVGDVSELARAITRSIDTPSYPDVRRRARTFAANEIVDQYLKVLIDAG